MILNVRHFIDDTYERIDAHLAQLEWRMAAYEFARLKKRSRRQAIRYFINPRMRKALMIQTGYKPYDLTRMMIASVAAPSMGGKVIPIRRLDNAPLDDAS
jgi:hypothetical protein